MSVDHPDPLVGARDTINDHRRKTGRAPNALFVDFTTALRIDRAAVPLARDAEPCDGKCGPVGLGDSTPPCALHESGAPKPPSVSTLYGCRLFRVASARPVHVAAFLTPDDLAAAEAAWGSA